MALPPRPNNPNNPIPNQPFTAPDTFYVAGPWFPVEVGTGVAFNTDTAKIANISNDGVLAIASVAGTGISVDSASGNYVIGNTGVLSLTAGPNISISAATGDITISASSTGVKTVTVVAPLQKGGTEVDPILSISSASTTGPGVVQLNDSTTSTSTTQALTAAQGKNLQDQINSLALTSNITLAGTFDASTGLVDSVTAVGTTAGFVVGNPLPAPSPTNAEFFVIVDVQGSTGPAGTPPYHIGDWFLSSGTAWQFLNVGFQAPQASTTVQGVVTLATDVEVQTGTNTTNAVVPSSLQSKLSDSPNTTSSTTIASSTAVKSAYDLASAAIPCAAVTGKGALVTGTAASTPTALVVGTDGQVLLADSSCTSGLKWGSAGGVTSITAGTGLCGGTITSTGTICLDPTAVVQSSAYSAKGVILAASSGSTPVALTVGTDGQILTACATSATGVCWAAAPLAGIPCSTITAKGDIVVGTAASTPAALPVGTYGQVLLADSGCASGLKWGGLPQASVAGLGVVYGCTTTAASCNTSLGYYSLAYTSATCAIVLGNSSMIGSQGDSHIAIGVGIAATQSGSSCNVVIGNSIGGGNFQGSSLNVVVGQYAACGCLSGSNKNVILGANAGTILNLACNNVAIGYGVAPPSSSSKCTLAIGYDTGCHWITGDCTKAVKFGAGIIDCADSCGTAGQVLMSNGSNAVCWGAAGGGGGSPATPDTFGTVYGCTTDTSSTTALGQYALYCTTTGTNNVAVGKSAGALVTSGSRNVFVGNSAGLFSDSASDSVAIGSNAASQNTGCFNVAVGSSAALCGSGGFSVAVGASAGQFAGPANTSVGSAALSNADGTSSNNTVIGNSAGLCLTTGSRNVFLGNAAGGLLTTESCRLAIGYDCNQHWILGCSNLNIKPGAGILDCAGSAGTAGQALTSTGGNLIKWATIASGTGCVSCTTYGAAGGLLVAGAANTPFRIAPGSAGQVLTIDFACTGYVKWAAPTAAAATTTALGALYGCDQNACDSVYIGYGSGTNATSCYQNTALGSEAMGVFSGSGSISTCICASIAIGRWTLASITPGCVTNTIAIGNRALGSGSQTASGDANVFIGNFTGLNKGTGDNNVVVGHNAGAGSWQAGRGNNTLIGTNANGSVVNGDNNTVIGSGASSASGASNSVTLGNSSITVVRAQVTTITGLSDARDKTDITALPVGLDFINTLNPVKFTWQMREPNEVKDGTSEAGFIAQELKEAQDAANADYLDLVYDQDPERLEASAGKLLPVLVKAIQELSAEVQELKARLDANG
jgi:hypothetical protein